ncbi:hypothetical protein [Actinophytocola sp.]|uniref:hypothetical protein n=1 Tax=Actinophytocola sp. TaxID=1872138 RepID=UPI0025BF3ADF|nr:hypothetical protein [Actinophytocola sp.]
MSVSGPLLGKLIVTPRPLFDYRNMFLLTDEELVAGPILDCPAGASPFGAQVRARGGKAVSVDPIYGPRTAVESRVAADLAHVHQWLAAGPVGLDWSYLGSADAMLRAFEVSADFFLADYAEGGPNYVAAGLPALPFADGEFGLTLSSHLLFTYPEYVSHDQHVSFLLEMARVTSGEVRVCPVADPAGVPYPRLDEVRTELASHGVSTELRQANSAYSKGGDDMLVCRRIP